MKIAAWLRAFSHKNNFFETVLFREFSENSGNEVAKHVI
jgi:hypothetical protein